MGNYFGIYTIVDDKDKEPYTRQQSWLLGRHHGTNSDTDVAEAKAELSLKEAIAMATNHNKLLEASTRYVCQKCKKNGLSLKCPGLCCGVCCINAECPCHKNKVKCVNVLCESNKNAIGNCTQQKCDDCFKEDKGTCCYTHEVRYKGSEKRKNRKMDEINGQINHAGILRKRFLKEKHEDDKYPGLQN